MQAEGQSRLRTVIIAGAGIGGLTASLALASKGFRVVVLEKAERLDEAGAGLQLSPNASRILIDLGLEAGLAAHVISPDDVSITSARAGKEIGRVPLGQQASLRFGAPYWIVHRADLQSALLTQVKANSNIELRLGTLVEDVAQSAGGIAVIQRQGTARHEDKAQALIGADGVWSTVRQRLFPKAQTVFTGRIAWRGSIDARQLPGIFDLRRVHLWLGPNAHLVAYPMSGGQRINVVAITSSRWDKPGWNEEADASEIQKQFARDQWPLSARALIDAVEGWRRWALFEVDCGTSWSHGHAALLGDAAHAMLPFAAQGAGMAIEDAAVLADRLSGADDVPAALERYGAARRARVGHIQRTARRTGQIYHLRGPMAFARDAAISFLSGERLLTRQDWIYGWRMKSV